MKYKIADLVVEFEAKYDMLKTRANKYLLAENEKRNFKLYVTEEGIREELLLNPNMNEEIIEYMIMGSFFYKALLMKNGCLLHASAVVIDDEAYLFSAPCGTRKIHAYITLASLFGG